MGFKIIFGAPIIMHFGFFAHVLINYEMFLRSLFKHNLNPNKMYILLLKNCVLTQFD